MMNTGLTWLKIGSELPLLHVEAPFRSGVLKNT